MNYNREPGRPFTLNSKPHHHSSHITEHLREQHSTTTPTRGRKNAVWPWLARLVALFSVYRRATCQTLFHWFHFTDFISLVSLYRLYCIGSSFQPSHWSDFIALVPVYSRTTGQTLLYWFQLAVLTLVNLYFMVSVCSPAAWQTLFDWFQFTALPLARRYRISISLQRCHLPDFTALFSVCSHNTGQTLLHWFELAVSTLVRL